MERGRDRSVKRIGTWGDVEGAGALIRIEVAEPSPRWSRSAGKGARADEEMIMEIPGIVNIQIQDDLSTQDSGAVEVTLTLSDNSRRWCYFMTPAALQMCGDWIDGTRVRFHYGALHMIVVSETLTEDIIRKALLSIEKRGEILGCTRAIDDSKAQCR